MQSRIIHDLPGFCVTSWGNGVAYELLCKLDGRSVFFQGDDAGEFRDRLEDLTENCPNLSYDDALRVIWHDYEGVAA